MVLPNQEMVDSSRNENEGYKVHSEGNGKIRLESAVLKNWGLNRIFNGLKTMLFLNDTKEWSYCNEWLTQVKIMKMDNDEDGKNLKVVLL